MEPDYLPIPQIFVLAVFVPQEDFIPELDFTPHEDYTPFHDRGGGGTSSHLGGLGGAPPQLGSPGASGPLAGVWGRCPQWGVHGTCPRSQKLGSFWPMVFGPLYYSSGFGTSSFGGWKTLYICIMVVYFTSSCIVKDPCVRETDRVKRKLQRMRY